MILTRIEITNYKQYGGHHVIEIPQSGAIGVIGANGVGKTTLFEAIEWALYSPNSIRSADVKPRTWRGKTEVKVTLDDPVTGARFLVERELGKGSAKARIYRVDQFGFEEKIVDGATQVTSYVTQHLIGLEHAAFVATFFTRQKELGFFNGSPTARRREVGKLLGLETIRHAQEIVAEERKRAQADARSYAAQSEAQSRDRDFPTEISAAEEVILQAQQALESARASVATASEVTQQAEKALAESEAVREQDSAIAQQILERRRDHDIAAEQVASATRDLERLDNLAGERAQLVPVAATQEPLEKEEHDHDADRQNALRKRELEHLLASLRQRDEEIQGSIREEIIGAPAPDGNLNWSAESPAEAANWSASIDVPSREQHAAHIADAFETNLQLVAESKTLASYHSRVEDLRKIEAAILQTGDPYTRIQEVQNRLQELSGSNAAANNAATRIKGEIQKTGQLIANLRTQHEGEICPTCQRPFTSEQTTHAISLFERDVESQREQLRQIETHIQANTSALTATQSDLQQLNDANKKLTETRASLETGNRYVQDQQQKVDSLADRLQTILQMLDRPSAPTVEERDVSQRDAQSWRKVVEAGAKVSRALAQRAQIANEQAPLQKEMGALGEAVYNEARHREVTGLLQRARQAQATIQRIDEDLARRDNLVSARDTAAKTMNESHQDLTRLDQERTRLGFNVALHQQAQAKVRAAQEQEKLATEQRHRGEVSLRDAENRLGVVKNEQDRIGRLVIEAEAKQREADDLDLMYKEFTEFERFAAAWYAPRLSEIASDLVSQVTDGKYDRVEFDNNFSIQVYDGDDEKFPYETFSGGERDAIALCARIALSRVIGGASSNPPGFLVLDEVFGSLDLERRQRLLEMLAAISGADDHFRQVFIISHVDDVRTSPILDDVWRVTETEEGTSELRPLGVGVDIGEL